MAKILVTGGAGFIGSHFLKLLCENKTNQIFCIDNLFTGSKQNIENLSAEENFEFIIHDIRKPISLDVEKIFNFACPASPIHYQRDPIYTLTTSVIGTLNLLELAVKNQAQYFHASTSEIYGDPEIHPQHEDYLGNVNPIGIRACYDEGKRAAETLIYDFKRTKNLTVKVARIFNTYGPNMSFDDGRVVSNFIVNAILNRDLEIYGDGQKTRSFCYIDDLISGINILSSCETDLEKPLNIGNNKEFTILELAKMIIDLTKSKSKIIFKDPLSDDPVKRQPDLTLINDLGWKPEVKLEDGLRKTIEYFSKLNLK